MNGILQPGISILEGLNFRGKFTLIGVIMFGVIGVLTTSLVRNLLSEIQSVQHEQRGMVTIGKVIPVLIAVQKHRGLNSAYLGGDASALTKVQAINARQEELIAAVDSDNGIPEFAANAEWDAVKTAWTDVRDHSSGYTKPQSFAAHTKLVATLQTFVLQLADASGVTLDPVLESYYLQDTALVKLIALTESIGKLRAKGAGVLAAKTATPEERAELILLAGNIGSYEQAVRQNLVKATAQNPELRKQFDITLNHASTLIAALQQTLKHEVLAEAPTMSAAEFFAQATTTIDASLELYGQSDQALNSTLQLRESELRHNMTVYLIGVALIVVLSIYFFMAMSASISAAVQEIDAVIESFAQGDLTRRVKLSSRDEMGNIASRFNAAGEHLRAIMKNVDRAVESVFDAASVLQASARQIAKDSDLESESVQATAAAIEQITVSISHVADNSQEASNVAIEGLKVSEFGETTVREAANEMNSIAASVSLSASLIDGLNDRARQISSIVGVIRDIADQTNLLALNAAIEAARAGEQGRGFAVVADEVRKLSERTGNATNEITAMIGNIQSETANAVSKMEVGSAQAIRGVQLAEDAAASLAQVHAGSQDTRVRIEEIASAMREQSAATTEIAQNLERISLMSESTNREVQNATMQINQLEELAVELRKQVASFKV